MPNQDANLDRVFQVLADPTRRAIVNRLSKGPATVSELLQPFSMALPSLLQHLRVLEDTRLIRTKKVGRVRTCELQPAPLKDAAHWLEHYRQFWEQSFDRLGAYLQVAQASAKKEKKNVRKRK